MLDIVDAPSSCRSCAFMVRCFGQPDEGPLVRPPIVRDLWVTTPIVANGIASRMITAGRTGPIVLLVHGEGGSADRWAFNLNALARSGFRAVAVDLPGHGFSGKSGPQSVLAYADFIGAIMDSFDEPVTLVGASVSAHVATRLAAARPADVAALVLTAGTSLPVAAESTAKLQRQIIYRTREGALERFRRAFWDTRIADATLVEQEFRMNTSPGAADAQRALAQYIADHLDARAHLAALRRIVAAIPTLIVWGEEDHLTPIALARDAIVRLEGRAKLITMPKTGHIPNFERPGEFSSHLIEFLQSPAPATARAPQMEIAL